MARRFAQTTGQFALALGLAGAGWWLLRRCRRPGPVRSLGDGCSARTCAAARPLLTRRSSKLQPLIPRSATLLGPVVARLLLQGATTRKDPLSSSAPAGRLTTASSYWLSRWLFLRLLGVVYLAAFVSLWVQVKGLIGRRGIAPVAEYLEEIRRATGRERYYEVPTLCWLDASDRALDRLCAGGVLLSGLLIVGIAPTVVLLLLWADYLSLTVACQRFLGYQWDALLLETSLHAALLAPPRLWPRLGQEPRPPRLAVWLLRWLLFRLMFTSGLVKLTSGDRTWRTGTALRYHYETQPLPTWTSWYMHQLPSRFHRLSTWFTFLVELGLPPLMFGPRRCRLAACAGTVFLQLLIAGTGNFGFFNFLTIALCVPLLDDACFPRRWQPQIGERPGLLRSLFHAPRFPRWIGWLSLPLAAIPVLLSGLELLTACGHRVRWPRWLRRLREILIPFRSLNSYGLFAVMTTSRPEIIVEGSHDGRTWQAYEFRWKPGDVRRRPAFTGLHMPRLDWQMWFAALSSYWDNPWLFRFLARLLEGSLEVLALLDHNPFANSPPRYVRALLYDYRFTDRATRKQTGAWWRRRRLGPYCPILTLERNEAA